MSKQMTIRKATIDDKPYMTQIYMEINADTIIKFDILKHKDVLSNTFVAMENSEVIGFILAEPAKTCYIVQYVCVTKTHEHKGIAGLLLSKIKEKARRYNKPIYLHHDKSLSEFYKKKGFGICDDMRVACYL